MSGSYYSFLTWIQISQEAGQVVWYSHFFKNFPQSVVIHTVKGFGIVNKAEVDVFWNSFAFSFIQWIIEKAREFQKTSTSALLTTPKPLTVWITTNYGKFFKRWEYPIT